MSKDTQLQINGIALEQYFCYHPPRTDERISKHNLVNELTFEHCRKLLMWCNGEFSRSDLEWYQSEFDDAIKDVCRNELCLTWAHDAVSRAYQACVARNAEAVLMYIQQARMFWNQGVAIDELYHCDFLNREGSR